MKKMATVLPQKPQGTYSFVSQPRTVQHRKKFRDQQQLQQEQQNDGSLQGQYANIMYDRRIVRGNTYAQNVLPTSALTNPLEVQRQQETRRRNIAKRRAKEHLRPKTVEAVEGRKHQDVQTELYLEELGDRVEEVDAQCQTDPFLDRPASPLFIPAKTGVDAATQIYDGDLFDFDVEVKPILEVLVGKTLEQASLEVMEEEELAAMRAQQKAFLELRNAELVETQRLEEKERRHREEKARRMQQQKEVLELEVDTSQRVAARAFAQGYLSDLVPSVFSSLTDSGYFYDPVERDLETGFMVWLMERVEVNLRDAALGRAMLDSIIRDIVKTKNREFEKLEAANIVDAP
ncbi:PREDICTED: radial spoke head protein 3 homolog [Priapulus caudatus]|uniref:Radial spoke head protein 3 homolog n=1 Tax=Priapulus caudatus TaxID=37621 RepID=A0ABM1DQ37_PRICU|nr:PREDICTED: radial spoke head protein 3 homolog [Priapulus caudatus]